MTSLYIAGLYLHRDRTVELVGTPAAWRELASVMIRGVTGTIGFDAPPAPTGPSDEAIHSLQLIAAPDPLEVTVQNHALVFKGSAISLETLAEMFQWLSEHPEASGGIQQHIHIEQVLGSWYSPSALPIVAIVSEKA